MRTLFKQYLSNKNIDFKVEGQNVISFIYSQHHYLMMYDEEDPNYFCICLPDVEASNSITDGIRTKMNQISREYKVAKLIEIESQVWITAETFVFNYVGIPSLFDRLIGLLDRVLIDYHSR